MDFKSIKALSTLNSLLEFRKHWVISFVQILASKPSKQTRRCQCLFLIVGTPRVLLASGYFTSFLIPHLCLLLSVHTHLFPHPCFIPERLMPMNCVTQVPFQLASICLWQMDDTRSKADGELGFRNFAISYVLWIIKYIWITSMLETPWIHCLCKWLSEIRPTIWVNLLNFPSSIMSSTFSACPCLQFSGYVHSCLFVFSPCYNWPVFLLAKLY